MLDFYRVENHHNYNAVLYTSHWEWYTETG